MNLILAQTRQRNELRIRLDLQPFCVVRRRMKPDFLKRLEIKPSLGSAMACLQFLLCGAQRKGEEREKWKKEERSIATFNKIEVNYWHEASPKQTQPFCCTILDQPRKAI